MDDLLANIGVEDSTANDLNDETLGGDLSDIFNVSTGGEDEEQDEDTGLSIRKKSFDVVTQFFSKEPEPFMKNPDYYKNVLNGSKEGGANLNKILQAYLTEKDQQEKSLLRNRLITAYWNFVSEILKYFAASNVKVEKQMMLRYGLLSPSLIQQNARILLSHVIIENNYDESIYYVDEWIRAVGAGRIVASTTDETKQVKKRETAQDLVVEKFKAAKQVIKENIRSNVEVRQGVEQELLGTIRSIIEPHYSERYKDLIEPYDSDQKSQMSLVSPYFTKLKSVDTELTTLYKELNKNEDKLTAAIEKANENNGMVEDAIDNEVLVSELDAVRQMTKMCVGRQGNHVPIVMSPFFVPEKNNIGTRENILRILAKIEEIEPNVFIRPHRKYKYRIPPNVIIVPCYGNLGVCWEPFEKFNRATSRGRIAIPMYPKDLTIAVLTAVADLRWQSAKEKASYHWMEEGITGGYYHWTVENKIKGNIKDLFVRDYVQWILKESEGTQKLEKGVREIFWRLLPFNQSIKDELKTHGFIYGELYKRDQNRAMSDGY